MEILAGSILFFIGAHFFSCAYAESRDSLRRYNEQKAEDKWNELQRVYCSLGDTISDETGVEIMRNLDLHPEWSVKELFERSGVVYG